MEHDQEDKDKEEHTPGEKYQGSLEYWKRQDATVNGMLGGYEAVSAVDLAASRRFLRKIAELPIRRGGPPLFGRAVDCGAGIGRVTKGCLIHHFDEVDMLEPVEEFLTRAKTFVQSDKVQRFICEGLQEFEPECHRYDCIWIQWCALYLTDLDLIAVLRRCKDRLRPNGVVCVKENVITEETEASTHDDTDNSVTRTDAHCKEIFGKCGLVVILQMEQKKFPKELFPVYMYCLR